MGKIKKGQIVENIEKLINLEWKELDIVKLKGSKSIFRVRKGNLRIIFFLKNEEVNILSVERRSEKTYKDY